jgi:type I restriction enzyme M protein
MAIKKTELYSSLWSACDALRGGMDASQYKDYVLVMLFWRYVSDKAKSDPRSLIEVPAGCGFDDLVALKGQSNIHEQMDKAIGALARANDLQNVIDVVSFQDEEKLGRGKEMVDRLSDLISIFQNPALDFTKNKASGDDLLGDAYEYLMMNFATESGKSKGQFYTPAEVSRVLAEVLEVNPEKEGQSIYDPTCGSGSLLLKVSDVIHKSVSLFGQEKDSSTAALAKMNMILHGSPTAEIARGQSTLSDPQFKDERGGLKTFDYVVANPPFSYDKWTYGFHPEEDIFRRFDGFGIPPLKNGDYAFLLHIVASLKPNGKAAVILPHGVLFRGNAEGEIRKNLIQRGLIKAVIGLPANLFYGTGIPACVIVIDKEGANSREEVFFVNAASGYAKDGAKNRLRERDIRKIVDVFKDRQQIPGFSKAVPVEEISNEKNSFNLNIPRYIDSSEQQDIQDIEAHLKGGIPLRDIEGLNHYWQAFPTLKDDLFENLRPGYLQTKVPNSELRKFILKHSDLSAFRLQLKSALESWEKFALEQLMSFEVGASPRELLVALSEKLKSGFSGVPLIDGYAMFQHLMDYWNSTLQDDLYIITQDGWNAIPYRIQETKKGKSVDKGWACDLIPKSLIVERYFKTQSDELASLEIELESLEAEIEGFTEEQNQEGGVFFTTEKVNKASANKLLKELKGLPETESEVALLNDYLKMVIKQAELKSKIKSAAASLDLMALRKYGDLSVADVKVLAIRDKWFKAIESAIEMEINGLQSVLFERIKIVSERYDNKLSDILLKIKSLEHEFEKHLIHFLK